jgi:outer membrane protein assembly factor BamB
MTAYPTLKRWLAACLTLLVVGIPLGYWIYRGGNLVNPIDSPVQAQGPKDSGDWIMYGGTPTRNMVNTTVKGLPFEWDVDKKINIKWVAGLGSKAYGGPIVANGRVIVGTNNQGLRDPKEIKPKLDRDGKPIIKDGKQVMEPIDYGVLMSFDEASGKFQWQSLHAKLPGGQEIDWPLEGLCSTPHVKGDRMFYVSNSCKLICAALATGKPHWTLDMIKELGVFPHNISDNSPLLIGDHLWVVTSNGVNKDHLNVPAPKAPSFIKVDKTNHKVLWQDNSPSAALLNPANVQQKDFFKALVDRGELIQHGQWSNAAYSKELNQVVFPGGDGWIYSFNPEGKLIWKFDCNPKDAKYALKTGERSDFIATPVIYKNRVYIGIGQDPEHKFGIGHFWCIDMTKKGDVSPDLVTSNKVFPPETKKNPNSAAIWHYGGLLPSKELQQKMKRLWYFGRTMSTCAIHEDFLYISDLDGVLHCLNANTGEPYWEHNCEAEIWSSPYYADGKIYLGTDEGVVRVFQHGKTKKLLAEMDMGGRVRATPVAANGVLFVMTENKLYAIKAK